jgi:hypothetical protein
MWEPCLYAGDTCRVANTGKWGSFTLKEGCNRYNHTLSKAYGQTPHTFISHSFLFRNLYSSHALDSIGKHLGISFPKFLELGRITVGNRRIEFFHS